MLFSSHAIATFIVAVTVLQQTAFSLENRHFVTRSGSGPADEPPTRQLKNLKLDEGKKTPPVSPQPAQSQKMTPDEYKRWFTWYEKLPPEKKETYRSSFCYFTECKHGQGEFSDFSKMKTCMEGCMTKVAKYSEYKYYPGTHERLQLVNAVPPKPSHVPSGATP